MIASEENPLGEPVDSCLLGRAGVVFELELGDSSFVCVPWVGSRGDRIKKRWR